MSTPGRSVDQFREMHDKSFIVPKRIKAGLEQLGDSWEYEGEFMKRCQLSSGDFVKYRDQFAEHFFEVRATGKNSKRVWCGTKRFASKLREQSLG